MNFELALMFHQKGDLVSARKCYILALENGSNRYESNFNLGMIDLQMRNFTSAVNFFGNAITLKPLDVESLANIGICYQHIGDFEEAENFFIKALEIDRTNIKIIILLAVTLAKQGKASYAVSYLEEALLLDPFRIELLVNLGIVLAETGCHLKALKYFERALEASPKNVTTLSYYATALMEIGQYHESLIQSNLAIQLDPKSSLGYLAKALALHKLQKFDLALENYEYALILEPGSHLAQTNIASITISKVKYESDFRSALNEAYKSHKMTSDFANEISHNVIERVPYFRLKHDVQQAIYLHKQGYSSSVLLKFLDVIPRILDEYQSCKGQELVILKGDVVATFRDYLSEHLIYKMPKVDNILNGDLDWNSIEEKYLSSEPELIFIDDFLNNQALNAFQNFSLNSKIWNKEYKGSYLGAFANQGFISPLHLKLALDLKRMMPRVFKDYPIGQLWGFKYDSQLGSGINVHADFAKVNLNFWITPSESNLDPNSGGLRVYTAPAPSTWTFHDYNRDSEQIYEFLSKNNSSSITVPYKGNRAVLFNSALFHETDAIKFKEGYEHRRVNMTYLFGSQLN